MEGIEKGKEENFAVPTPDPVATASPTPVATATPERKLVKIKKFDKEYELPLTQEEIDEFVRLKDTPEEKAVFDELKENFFEKVSSLTLDEIDTLVHKIPEKFLRKTINQIRTSIFEHKDTQAKRNYHHFVSKVLDKYKSFEKSEEISKAEDERLIKERKFLDDTLSKIIKEDESTAKQHLKGLSKEERDLFNKSYKARIGEMYKTNPNAQAMIESTSKKVKDVFDKAVLEKAKQDKLAKEEEAKKKALLPPQATAAQPSQPEQQRTLSRGRQLIRSKSATKTETPAEEPKRVQIAEAPKQELKRQQVAEAPKREEPVSSDLKAAYKDLRREITDIGRDNREYSSAQILRRLNSKIPDEVLIEDALNLPTLEQITEAIDQRDKNKLKEYMREYEAEPINYGNRKIAATLKSLLGDEGYYNPIERLAASRRHIFGTGNPTIDIDRQFNSAKEQLKKDLPEVQKALLTTIESRPKLKEAYERLMKKREEAAQAQAIPVETPVETPRSVTSVPSRVAQSEARSIPRATTSQTPQSLFSALSRTAKEDAEAETYDDEEEAYQEDLRRAKRESLREQEEAARNKSGKRAALPATTLETDLDQEIDEEAFQEATKNYPGDVIPRPERREQPILPEQIPAKDEEGNPIDMASYIKSVALKAFYDLTNSNMQNPPKKAAFFGEEAPSILANQLRSDYAQHGNPLSDQYRARMNQFAELMVKDQLIEQAAEILKNSPNETDREQARKFILDRKMVNDAASRITSSPTFKDDIKKYIDDNTYESQAADLLKPATTYEGKAADTLDTLPDLTPDINFELTPEEKALHEANVKAFIDQATRNFERTDLRRAQNRYSGRNVWNSGLAAQERSEVWQDFNRHLADKQLQMYNEARQQSFLRKKELHEQKVKQAAALLQKSRAWLDTNVLKNRNQTEMANALSGLQGLKLQRAKEFSQFESVLNAGRHGDAQALAALQMTQQEAAQQFERMQHQKEQTSIQRATSLSNVGGQHAGQIINASNAFGNMASAADQNLFSRIASGQEAGERMKHAKQERDRYETQTEAESRKYLDQQLHALQNASQAAEGLPVQEPVYTLNPHPAPQHIPGVAPPVDNTFTNLAGLGLSAIGTIGNYQNQALANKALEAQTRLYNAQANQIPQIPVAGDK